MIPVIIYVLSYNIGPCFNGTQLYVQLPASQKLSSKILVADIDFNMALISDTGHKMTCN